MIDVLRKGGAGNKPYRERLTVIKDYGSMTLCRTKAGSRVCVSIGDLVVSGIVSQDDEKEKLRLEVTQSYGPWHKKR